jgi:hypothetical protein
MKAEITPGPWAVNRINGKLIIGGRAFGIANVLSVAEVTKLKPHSEANARLIAAAPELLAACESLLPFLQHRPNALATVRAAIAKAKGTAYPNSISE